jgi:hypothetical protein
VPRDQVNPRGKRNETEDQQASDCRIQSNGPSLLLTALALPLLGADIRIGIIGTDTSHVPAFTRQINDPSAPGYIPGARVVAAFKGGSPDIESSHTRVDKYAEEIQSKWGVEIVPDIATLVSKVDAVLIESVDGRPHLEQARQVFAAKKPVFIDKPLASTLADVREIDRLAKQAGVPWFSSSSLRWSEITETLKFPDITGAHTWGPGPDRTASPTGSLVVRDPSHRSTLHADGSRDARK